MKPSSAPSLGERFRLHNAGFGPGVRPQASVSALNSDGQAAFGAGISQAYILGFGFPLEQDNQNQADRAPENAVILGAGESGRRP